MSVLFNRKVTLLVGNPDQPMPLVEASGVSISNLRVTFDITKTSTTECNTAKIVIYNLSQKTRDLIDSVQGLIIVKAGYENLQETIFVGNITYSGSVITRPEVITTIDANDGFSILNQLKIPSPGLTGSYSAGVSVKKVLRDIIKHSGVTVANASVLNQIADRQYKNGFAFAGAGKVLINNLCCYLGLEWSIQNNQIKFIKTFSSDEIECALITPQTGMIGSPERLQDVGKELYSTQEVKTKVGKTTTLSGKKVRKKVSGGWRVRSLLHPKIEPGSVVVLQCNDIQEQTKFRVIQVNHKGDTHGPNWETSSTVMEK